MSSLLGIDEWLKNDRFEGRPPLSPEFSTLLVAHRFDSWTYTKMDPRAPRLGSAREGQLLWGKAEDSHRGCGQGWYALAQGGYACAGGSFRVAADEVEQRDVSPALNQLLPYDYVQVTNKGAPRYDRIPRPEEECAPRTGSKPAGAPLDVFMEGGYFLAVTAQEEDQGRRFYRTLREKYVRAEDVEVVSAAELHGKKNPALPLAFVIAPDTPRLALRGEHPEKIGHAARYSTFPLDRVVVRGEARYAVDREGRAVPRSSVRVARSQPRPARVGPHEKWLVVDLSEQTLVAYEGDTAILATLVSSGRQGHETPTGAFRIEKKYISKTMQGEDPIDGPYEVGEVPWTMYYHGAYALHGAYWHDQFGNVKSHGCTNLAPADARWLLRWTDPPLPTGWHSIRSSAAQDGTRVYFIP